MVVIFSLTSNAKQQIGFAREPRVQELSANGKAAGHSALSALTLTVAFRNLEIGTSLDAY